MKNYDVDSEGKIIGGTGPEYVSYDPSENPDLIVLDGTFDIEELEELIKHMKDQKK